MEVVTQTMLWFWHLLCGGSDSVVVLILVMWWQLLCCGCGTGCGCGDPEAVCLLCFPV